MIEFTNLKVGDTFVVEIGAVSTWVTMLHDKLYSTPDVMVAVHNNTLGWKLNGANTAITLARYGNIDKELASTFVRGQYISKTAYYHAIGKYHNNPDQLFGPRIYDIDNKVLNVVNPNSITGEDW